MSRTEPLTITKEMKKERRMKKEKKEMMIKTRRRKRHPLMTLTQRKRVSMQRGKVPVKKRMSLVSLLFFMFYRI